MIFAARVSGPGDLARVLITEGVRDPRVPRKHLVLPEEDRAYVDAPVRIPRQTNNDRGLRRCAAMPL